MAKQPDNAADQADDFLNEDSDDLLTNDDVVGTGKDTSKMTSDDVRRTRSGQPSRAKEKPKLEFKSQDPDDKRPRVAILEPWLQKKFGAKGMPVSMDVSPLMLPPITRKRFAVYELIQDVKVDPRVTKGDATVKPPPAILPPTYMYHDRGEKDMARQTKLMKLVERLEPVRGVDSAGQPTTSVREILGQIEFLNGQVIVPILENYPKFVWMELCPWNESNKWRTVKHLTIFRRVDQQTKSTHQELIRMDLQRDAEEYVRSISKEKDQLVALAAAMTNPTIAYRDVDAQSLYRDLRMRARLTPEDILYKTPDKKAAIRMNLIHALDMGILEFNVETMSYYGSWTGDKEPLLKVNISEENPLNDLTTFCQTGEGAEIYEDIMKILDYWV